jgi:hypothetical protein
LFNSADSEEEYSDLLTLDARLGATARDAIRRGDEAAAKRVGKENKKKAPKRKDPDGKDTKRASAALREKTRRAVYASLQRRNQGPGEPPMSPDKILSISLAFDEMLWAAATTYFEYGDPRTLEERLNAVAVSVGTHVQEKKTLL